MTSMPRKFDYCKQARILGLFLNGESIYLMYNFCTKNVDHNMKNHFKPRRLDKYVLKTIYHIWVDTNDIHFEKF